MKLVHIKNPNFEVMKKIVEIEQEAFEGAGNVDLWIVKALIRYGLVFVITENDKIVCIVEYMQVFNKKSLFLYGISTLKKYRHKGYANYILNETEKILKNNLRATCPIKTAKVKAHIVLKLILPFFIS